MTSDDARALATAEHFDSQTARQTAHELIATGTYFDHGQAMLRLLDVFDDVQAIKEKVSDLVSELTDVVGELRDAKTEGVRKGEYKRLDKAIEALTEVIE